MLVVIMLLRQLRQVDKMKSLFKNDLRQLKNIAIIYNSFVLLNLIIIVVSYEKEFPAALLTSIVFIFSLVVPAFNLNYLFDANKCALYLSMPISKKQSFLIKYFSGLLILVLPLCLYGLVLAFFDSKLISSLLITVLLDIWIYYTLCCFTAYLTTTIIVNMIFQIVLFLTPIIIFLCIFLVCQGFFRGVVLTGMPDFVISGLIPFYKMFRVEQEWLPSINIIIYCVYGLILFIGAYLACIKRNPLQSYHGFSNRIIGRIIKIVIIIVISWSIVALMDFSGQSVGAFIAISIFATFMTVYLIQYLYVKKIRYLKNTIEATLISIVTLLIFAVGKVSIENYIPDNIESAALNHNLIYNLNENQLSDSAYISNQQVITNITDIHQYILDDKESYGDYEVGIIYQLNNGRKITRSYKLNYNDYQTVVSKFDSEMIKSWYSDYYDLLTILDKTTQIEFSEYSSGIIDHTIDSLEDILLFKNLLLQQLQSFENTPSLVTEVQEKSLGTVYCVFESEQNSVNQYYLQYSVNDPFERAVEEFYKIKAN